MAGKEILVDVVFRSASGQTLTNVEPSVLRKDLNAYAASEETREKAVAILRDLGFTIVGPATAFGVTVSGSPDLVEATFGGRSGPLDIPEPLRPWVESARIPPPGEFY